MSLNCLIFKKGNKTMIRNITNKLIQDGISLPYFLYCLENIPGDVEDMCIFNDDELQFLEHISKTEKNNLIKTYNKYAFKQFDMEIPEYIKKQLKEAYALGFSTEGLGNDLQKDCHDDYEFDIIIPKFIKENTKNRQEYGILISKLYSLGYL